MCTSDHGNHPIAVDVTDTAAASVAPSPEIVEELVAANHILFDQGVVDAFGHISVRHDGRPDRFLLARNMAPSRVEAEDIVEFTLDGEAVNAAGRKVYLERFIHAEIFRKRPDVMAVVHSHSHSIKQAVYRAVYAELNARYQLQAMQLGDVTYLTEGESRACVASIEAQVHRPWEMWLEQAHSRRR
jgi:ribulose-5-phosphate 4-epimerase/fuculose-1-phosphate aldolase